MRKLIIALVVAVPMTLGVAVPTFADPSTPACNGLDVAHAQVHSSGTQGELTLHDLRADNHCGHTG